MEIPEEKWKHAHRLFQCLIVSFRPLRVEELAEVLAIRFDSETTPGLIMGWRPENTEDAILSVCSSLISVVKVDDALVVQFAHFSVEEYLTSNRLVMAQPSVSRFHPLAEPAHHMLAQACLSTLVELDEQIDKDGLKNYPLAFYAAWHWFSHTRIEDASVSMVECMEQLFDADKPHFSAWIWLYDVKQRWRTPSIEDIPERPSEPDATPLYYSAAFGFRSLAERLVATHPDDINRKGSFWAPLWVATNKRYLDIARLLLEHGARVNIRGYGDWTLLHRASYGGDSDVIQLLLEHGADVDCTNDSGGTPLHLASQVGCTKAMQLLLEHGADVNKRIDDSPCCWIPLCQAIFNRHVEAVRLLIQYGANVNDENDGCTPLHVASSPSRPSEGSLEITRILLENGASVHARDKSNMTPLEFASLDGDNEIVQLLSKHSAR